MHKKTGIWFQEFIKAWVAWQLKHTPNPSLREFVRSLSGDLAPEERVLLEEVEALRLRYLGDSTNIEILDNGAGDFFGRQRSKRTIASVVRDSAIPTRWGIILWRMIRALRPRKVLELGTNLGISASFILSALLLNDDESRLVSIEGDPTLAAKSSDQVGRLAPGRCRVITGRFQDVLPTLVREMKEVDFVFIDGHHQYAATVANFDLVKSYLSPTSCVLFDDISTRPGVRRAWKQIGYTTSGVVPLNLFRMGLLVPRADTGKE